MTIVSEQRAKEILSKALAFSKAEGCECRLEAKVGGNIRYARNTVSTAGQESDMVLAVRSIFGKREGIATINEYDAASLQKVVRRSEELARLSPENPEQMPLFGAQKYLRSNTYFDATAQITPDYRANVADASITPSNKSKLVASGFLEDEVTFVAILNSEGLFAYNKATNVDFSVTIRTEDGRGSGWASANYSDTARLDAGVTSQIAIAKSMGSVDAKEMEPGRYTVILEPAASYNLIRNMMFNFDQRAADEGRSFLSNKLKKGVEGPKNKLGQKMFDERVNLYSDPQHPIAPTAPFNDEGYPLQRIDWVKNGVIANMPNSRYWAGHTDVAYSPWGNNFIMDGGDESLEEMIKNTRRGVLVTRMWYIRTLDRQTLLYTGLTRDGTFYIENGKIKYPIKNFRFNESPIVMLNNVEALGKPERIEGNMIPPMKIRDFTFSSLSDAV